MKRMLLLFALPLLLSGCNSTNNNSSSDQGNSEPIITNNDVVVIYFSRTGHTKPLAEYAQEHLNASLYEIIPSVPYTDEDINYNNSNSRANKEQNDSNARPEIQKLDIDLSKYSTVLLGYPIWWGQAPKVMYTFVENYSLEGKTVLPFWTSASSVANDSDENLAVTAKAGNWINGRRFAIGTDKETFTSWLDESLK